MTSHLVGGQFFKHAASTPLSTLLINLELATLEHPGSTRLSTALLSAQHLRALFQHDQTEPPSPATTFPVLAKTQEILYMIKSKYPQILFICRAQFPHDIPLHGNSFLWQEALSCGLNNAAQSYRQPSPNQLVSLQLRVAGKQLHVSITDGGCGLNWWQQRLVQLPGFTLRDKEGGTGQGLSVIKEVIQQHFHGKVTILSAPRRGTTLSWSVPIGCP